MNELSNTIRLRPFFRSLVSVCAVCGLLAGSAFGQEIENGSDVTVTDYGTVDLAVQDTDLAQVLQMLSIQSRKNIITSKSVSATVTANLYDVTFHEALDAILRVNGYGYVEEGNFIYIYTKSELEEIERAQRQTESRIFELEYLSALDAREFAEPLLSDDGKISHHGEVRPGFKADINDGGADEYAFAARLVVNDYPQNLERIAELLRELDTPPKQVLVEATVLRTRLFEDNAFGIDFSVLGRVDFTDFFTPFTAVEDLVRKGQSDTVSGTDTLLESDGSPATETTGFRPADNRGRALTSRTTTGGGLQIGIIQDNVSVFLRVLDEVTDSTVLARPKIMALNRQRAEVLVGEKVAFRSSTATETAVTQRVEFLDTGIALAFRPFISRNDMIRLELQPKVSFATLRDTGDGDTLPDEFTNELTTNVRVADGQTLVLGGLFEEDIQKTRRQIPILGDIPLLGIPFRGQEDRVRRNEIIFLITPTILHDETLWEMGRDSLAYAEAVQVGARAGLLPFSRDRITNNYNQQAVDAYNRGDLKMAHYYINNSLRLNTIQPEMLRLRQKITGVSEKPHERSIMERIYRRKMSEFTPEARVRPHEDRQHLGEARPMEPAHPTRKPLARHEDEEATPMTDESVKGDAPNEFAHGEPEWDEPTDPETEADEAAYADGKEESDDGSPVAEAALKDDAETGTPDEAMAEKGEQEEIEFSWWTPSLPDWRYSRLMPMPFNLWPEEPGMPVVAEDPSSNGSSNSEGQKQESEITRVDQSK